MKQDSENKVNALSETEEHKDSWWYRVYAAALIFTAIVVFALWLFDRTFSS